MTQKSFLSKKFDIKDMGDAKHVLSIKFDRDISIRRLGLSYRAYINKVLERYDIDKCAPGEVRVTKGDVFASSQCAKNQIVKDQVNQSENASTVGGLMYNMICRHKFHSWDVRKISAKPRSYSLESS